MNKGPGVGNIAAGAIYLAKENVPAVFIMAQRQRFYEQRVRRGKMQYLSQPPLFQNAMKYVGVIEYPEQVDEIVHEAFRKALSGVPGPTMVEMPLSVMQAEIDLPPALAARSLSAEPSARSGRCGRRGGAALLEDAKNPILLVGQGAFVAARTRAWRHLRRRWNAR